MVLGPSQLHSESMPHAPEERVPVLLRPVPLASLRGLHLARHEQDPLQRSLELSRNARGVARGARRAREGVGEDESVGVGVEKRVHRRARGASGGASRGSLRVPRDDPVDRR